MLLFVGRRLLLLFGHCVENLEPTSGVDGVVYEIWVMIPTSWRSLVVLWNVLT